jgi:hypothetical protein
LHTIDHAQDLHVIEVDRRQANSGKREKTDESGEYYHANGRHAGLAPQRRSTSDRPEDLITLNV